MLFRFFQLFQILLKLLKRGHGPNGTVMVRPRSAVVLQVCQLSVMSALAAHV